MDNKKLEVQVPIPYAGVTCIDGRSYEEAILRLQETLAYLKEEYPQCESFHFNYLYDAMPLRTYGVRKETDEEYDKRIKEEREQKSEVRKKELAELQRLKEKYDN